MVSSPLILTLQLDPDSFDQVDQLRQQYFPAARNFLPAHVTLFHALPGDQAEAIASRLQTLCEQTAALPFDLPTLRLLGQGVAIEVDSPPLVQLRQTLAKDWQPWLTRQDQQPYRPHITIQNKVPATAARQLYEQLSGGWRSIGGSGEGLSLWSYQGGPWELVQQFHFQEG